MKLTLLFALAFALQAQGIDGTIKTPPDNMKPTVEQLQAQIAALKHDLADAGKLLVWYKTQWVQALDLQILNPPQDPKQATPDGKK